MNEIRNELLEILTMMKQDATAKDGAIIQNSHLKRLLERFEYDITDKLRHLEYEKYELENNLKTLEYVRKELNIGE